MRIKLGIPMTLEEIAGASKGALKHSNKAIITHISTDSRELFQGDLFIALKGNNFDGTSYVEEAKNNNCYVLSSREDKSDIFHPDTSHALLNLASDYAKNLPYLLYKIGITGSVGKTTTKEFAKILLSNSFITHASEENFNNGIGMSLSVLKAPKSTEILLMEMGMNSPGEIAKLSESLRPDIALITNIGTAHIGRLGSREKIAEAKLEILCGMGEGTLIVPKDEKLLSGIDRSECFSISDPIADYYLKSEKNDNVSIYKNGRKYCDGVFMLSGDQYKKCLIAAVSLAIKIGVSSDRLSQRLALISNDNIRQNIFYAKNYCFYEDCYNASRESMIAAIESFANDTTDGKKSLVLGDVLELGEMENKIHFEIGNHIPSDKIHNLFLFGKAVENIGKGAISKGFHARRIFINSDLSRPDITAEQIGAICSPGEHILFKASRGVRLERVIDYFTENEKGETT